MIRHIFYMAEHSIILSSWDRKKLVSKVFFPDEKIDIPNFKMILENLSDDPIQILVNVQEEDFQRETIPYANKKDQHFMASRLQKKYYREAQYSQYLIQGRNTNGRKDSRLLLSSLSLDSSFSPYLDILSELKLPVAGFWSVPLLSHLFLEKSDFDFKHYILVIDEGDHLRESLFINKELVLSRRIKCEINLDDSNKANAIVSSIEHLYKFSSNKRFIQLQETMNVLCVVDNALYKTIEINNKEGSFIVFNLLDKAIFLSGIKNEYNYNLSLDDVYSSICGEKKLSKPHYKKENEIFYFNKKTINDNLFKFSIVGIFILMVISSSLFIYNNNQNKILSKIDSDYALFQKDYDDRFSSFIDVLNEVDNVQFLLDDASRNQTESDIMPTDLFHQIGSIMDKQPFSNIFIKEIRWKRYSGAEYDAINAFFSNEEADDEDYSLSLDAPVEKVKTSIFVHLSGLFDYDESNYSAAVNVMVAYNNALKNMHLIDDVYMVSSPVDVREQSQFIDFSGSLLSLNINKEKKFEFILSIKNQGAINHDG